MPIQSRRVSLAVICRVRVNLFVGIPVKAGTLSSEKNSKLGFSDVGLRYSGVGYASAL